MYSDADDNDIEIKGEKRFESMHIETKWICIFSP